MYGESLKQGSQEVYPAPRPHQPLQPPPGGAVCKSPRDLYLQSGGGSESCTDLRLTSQVNVAAVAWETGLGFKT